MPHIDLRDPKTVLLLRDFSLHFVCFKCKRELHVNEQSSVLRMNEDGEWDLDLSGMMCECNPEEDPDAAAGDYWEAILLRRTDG